jgi:hypothetical protein
VVSPPFDDERAAWIRENAWTPRQRQVHHDVPQAATTCACQAGPTGHCSGTQHGRCTGALMPTCETYLCDRSGTVVVSYPGDTKPRHARGSTVRVWLADRVCRYRCPCTCHPNRHRVLTEQPARDEGGQFALFA